MGSEASKLIQVEDFVEITTTFPDDLIADDIAEVVDRYRKLLEQLDEPFPKSFVLQDVVDRAAPQP